MGQARIIDGRILAAKVRDRVAEDVATLKREHGLRPGLAVVLVGNDPGSEIYVRSKEAQTLEAGMYSLSRRLPEETTQDELLAVVAALNADPAIHGILVQFPVPPQIDPIAVQAAIHPGKDVDGLSVTNAGRLAVGLPGLIPCTPLGSMIMLRETLGELRGKSAVVVGRSNLVGKPMARLLLQADCTVTVAHSRTRDLPAVTREAEILVAAVGQPEMVRGDWIRPGATVIDVGMNRIPSRRPKAAAAGKTIVVGDVAFDEAMAVASAVTPVPGGVGLMTVACLLRNTVTAARRLSGMAE